MTDTQTLTMAELGGRSLGERRVSYTESDAILYALALGASADELDLVYERDLSVLPTYGCALGLWAVEQAGTLGAYDPHRSLHASQGLQVKKPLPRNGDFVMTGQISTVLDKGKAAMIDIEVECEYFVATYTIFLPGMGGWGGSRGEKGPAVEVPELDREQQYATDKNLAALYRLTGDRHPVHIDPEVASANGFDRPILHGLCTLGITARLLAEQADTHPANLESLQVRLSLPVLPGQALRVCSGQSGSDHHFQTLVNDEAVLSGGQATFRD